MATTRSCFKPNATSQLSADHLPAAPTMSDLSKQPDVEKEPIPGVSEDAIRSGSVTAAGISEKIVEHSHDADAAMKAFAEYQGQVLEIDEATNARLLRKIDWHLMPVR